MRSTSWLLSRSLVFLFLIMGIVGCGSNAKARVKGKVKFSDKYLNAGTVAFLSKDGQIGSGSIDAEGNYDVPDAPVGEVTITVKVPSLPIGPGGFQKPPKGLPPGDSGTTSAMADPRRMIQIPLKFSIPAQSGLTYTVQKGENTYEILLPN